MTTKKRYRFDWLKEQMILFFFFFWTNWKRNIKSNHKTQKWETDALPRTAVIPEHLIHGGAGAVCPGCNLVQKRQGVRASCRAPEHRGPPSNQRGMNPALQDEGWVSDLGRGKGVQELSSLTGKAASNLSRQDDKPSPPMVPHELWGASFLPGSGSLHGSSAHGGTTWAGRPILRQRAHQGGVDGQLCPSEERQAVNHNLESTWIEVVDGVEIQISDQDVRVHPATHLSANVGCCVFERKPPSAQDPGDCTSWPVVAKAVKETATPARMNSQGKGHPQASQEQDSERLRINPEHAVHRPPPHHVVPPLLLFPWQGRPKREEWNLHPSHKQHWRGGLECRQRHFHRGWRPEWCGRSQGDDHWSSSNWPPNWPSELRASTWPRCEGPNRQLPEVGMPPLVRTTGPPRDQRPPMNRNSPRSDCCGGWQNQGKDQGWWSSRRSWLAQHRSTTVRATHTGDPEWQEFCSRMWRAGQFWTATAPKRTPVCQRVCPEWWFPSRLVHCQDHLSKLSHPGRHVQQQLAEPRSSLGLLHSYWKRTSFRRILACCHNSSAKTLWHWTVRSGGDTAYKSSRKAINRSPSLMRPEASERAVCWPSAKRRGINGSPCSPPSPWRMWWVVPTSSSHRKVEGLLQKSLMNGNNLSPSSRWTKPAIMAFLEIKSNAPTPSTDRTVARGSRSNNVWSVWETHSHPARVFNAHWKGAMARSTAAPICWAIVRATKRRRTSPTTMPLTPPLAFLRALIRPLRITSRARGGMSPLANASKLNERTHVVFRLQQREQVFARHSWSPRCRASTGFPDVQSQLVLVQLEGCDWSPGNRWTLLRISERSQLAQIPRCQIPTFQHLSCRRDLAQHHQPLSPSNFPVLICVVPALPHKQLSLQRRKPQHSLQRG